jgi:hypothetical protein
LIFKLAGLSAACAGEAASAGEAAAALVPEGVVGVWDFEQPDNHITPPAAAPSDSRIRIFFMGFNSFRQFLMCSTVSDSTGTKAELHPGH